MRIINNDIIYVYTEYVEFIINRDKAKESAIYHEINKFFPDIF